MSNTDINKKSGVNPGAGEGYTVLESFKTPFMLLIKSCWTPLYAIEDSSTIFVLICQHPPIRVLYLLDIVF